MGYQPIEDYGVIGNMRTVALVGMNGSIDWFCCPHFDSPSLFAAILDDKKGGHFKIAPVNDDVTNKQLYWPETNVLVTRFLSPAGVAEVTDFMPVATHHGEDETNQLIRRVTMVRGSMRFRMECFPAFNYATEAHETRINESGATFRSKDMSLQLVTSMPLTEEERGVTAEFTLEEGQTVSFAFENVDTEAYTGHPFSEAEADQLFTETVDYWRKWLAKSRYRGRWRETVERSALVLKLMTFEPTGAIVAAPTCSLPEELGGERNWDYRYTWIRDAAFTLYGLLRIGFTDEAASFMKWIEARTHELNADGSLQIMYGIDGRHELPEQILHHLEGYRGSGPVRIGNDAHGQLQLDIYGELMDAVYLYNKYGSPISYDFWTHLRELINWVCANWRQPDDGVWEVRGGRQQFVYSKVMCWVALDRAIRLADKRSFPADRERWHKTRDEIYEEVMTLGWNEDRQAFVQSYGSDSLDAANLIMPLVFFISPTDPRMLSTIDGVNASPAKGGLVANGLVYRYNVDASPDGLEGEEGTFNICTFWLVEALTRAGRFDRARLDQARLIFSNISRARLDQARLMFEKMLGYANHLGLYAEETGHSGESLGNFPQAFTHLSLISAAYNLDRTIEGTW